VLVRKVSERVGREEGILGGVEVEDGRGTREIRELERCREWGVRGNDGFKGTLARDF
jgi:hypothetical protein